MEGMKGLEERGLDLFLRKWVESGKYILGICLGMQLLFDKSYEMGECEDKGYNPGYSFHGRMLALAQVEGMMAVVDDEKERQMI